MRFLLVVPFILAASLPFAAVAQDRTASTIRQSDVRATGGDIQCLRDGGCLVQPRAEGLPDDDGVSRQITCTQRTYNKPLCQNVCTLLQKAVELDAKVGDGGIP